MNRRNFLELGSYIVASTWIGDGFSKLDSIAKVEKIGLQLYTVRNEMSKDPSDTLRKIAKIGYTNIESAGYDNRTFYKMSPAELRKRIDGLGLKMVSGHIGLGIEGQTMGLNYNFGAVCEDAVQVGQNFIGTGWIEPKARKTVDDYKRFAEYLNIGGEKAKKYKLNLFHHNHDFEFKKIDGIVPFDILLDETDKNLVSFELDHYWLKRAGVDSIKLMNDHPSRFSLWHIKDMDNTEKQAFTEVGTGIIDYQRIFKEKSVSGMKYYFVEQDNCTKYSPLESIEISFSNLKKLKK